MANRTYYDILGVSRNATLEEITNAKNAMAKIYHPDANIKNNIDTTARMQEILEAYRVLSNPEKRRRYDQRIFGGRRERVFRTFTVKPPEGGEEKPADFVRFWNAACKLNEVVSKSEYIIEQYNASTSLSSRILKKLGKHSEPVPELDDELNDLAVKALKYMTELKAARIPMNYWHPDAMNWVMVRWGQKQVIDYKLLFAKYDDYVEHNKTKAEKLKLHNQSKQFQNSLKHLLEYAV